MPQPHRNQNHFLARLRAWTLPILFLIGFPAYGAPIHIIDAENNPLVGAFIFQLVHHEGSEAKENEQNETNAQQQQTSTAHMMEQVNRQFFPQLLLIQPGDIVSFPNNDNMRHHVYSFSEARSFEFQLYATGTAPSVDFPELGLVTVGCNIHDDMIGHIIVSNNPVMYETDAEGIANLTEHEKTQLEDWYIWHPWFGAQGFGPLALADYVQEAAYIKIPVSEPAPAKESELEQRFRRRLQREH
ncbi:cupredoxin domain-containing protein [Aliidiomarina indica]|uniref:hypothetical protein n=1 Tax=Aliidiomarina indica TaxID=2749147 RepID=UPI00188F9391|nr:hypothetical protein [Aliidiomarina indica]